MIHSCKTDIAMSDLIWLSPEQLVHVKPYFPLSHGVPRVDDRRVLSGIIFVIGNGLRWRDAPKGYGPHKAIYQPTDSQNKWREVGSQVNTITDFEQASAFEIFNLITFSIKL